MVQINRMRKVAFISSFPPHKCGIDTFASDLIHYTYPASEKVIKPVVVAVQSGSSRLRWDSVEYVIRKNYKSDYMEAADFINSGGIESVSLQHEFGLFGGQAGSYIVLMLRRLNVPVISTLHNVLKKPIRGHFRTLVDICDCSKTVIVMSRQDIDTLRDLYGIPSRKIRLISDGVENVHFEGTEQYKYKSYLSWYDFWSDRA